MFVISQKILASILGPLKCVIPKCTFLGPQLNRRVLVWYLLNSSKAHALRGLDKGVRQVLFIRFLFNGLLKKISNKRCPGKKKMYLLIQSIPNLQFKNFGFQYTNLIFHIFSNDFIKYSQI